MTEHLDHWLLTTVRQSACIDFHTCVLGILLKTFVGGTLPVERKAFKFGGQKINLHVRFQSLNPKSIYQCPGCEICALLPVCR